MNNNSKQAWESKKRSCHLVHSFKLYDKFLFFGVWEKMNLSSLMKAYVHSHRQPPILNVFSQLQWSVASHKVFVLLYEDIMKPNLWHFSRVLTFTLYSYVFGLTTAFERCLIIYLFIFPTDNVQWFPLRLLSHIWQDTWKTYRWEKCFQEDIAVEPQTVNAAVLSGQVTITVRLYDADVT